MHRVVGIGFDHMHMGDQLRLAVTHPEIEIVGTIDRDAARMARVCRDVGVEAPTAGVDDADAALDSWQPDLAIVCSTTAEHRDWVLRLAGRGVAVVLEKPFAPSLDDAESMIATADRHGIALGVNWPLAWVPGHRTLRRLVADGAIGALTQVHYYGGNRGPLLHGHGKVVLEPGDVGDDLPWWYRRSAGGGSLRDYLGYGTTLGTWFRAGERPRSVTAVTHVPEGLEVDEQSVVIASYAGGLSTFQTRWGTFTDPWTHQTQPRCGFVVTGTEGTISSWDYAGAVTLQDARRPQGVQLPVDDLPAHESNSVAAMVRHLDTGAPLDGPMSMEINRTGQLIVEAAVRSADTGATVDLAAHAGIPA